MSGREIGADLTERSLTLAEFQFVEHLSPATYSKLKAAGLAPEETVIQLSPIEEGDGDGKQRSGFNIKRITPDARRAWHAMLAQLRASKEAELAAARAHAQRVQAGRIAAQSPLHVSRQKQRKGPRRRQGR